MKGALRLALAAVAGALFGAGLLLAGMTDPRKVLGFLDVTGAWGAWDPSLAFVMIGAIGVHALAYIAVRRDARPLLSPRYHLPPTTPIDRQLLAGAAVFGIGWGLAGYCPGPALVAGATGGLTALVFLGAMLLGMVAERIGPLAGGSIGR